MTPELTALTLAALLQVVQLSLYSVAGRAQVGAKTALKPRDEPVILTGKTGRIQRAANNHFEGLILFATACIVVSLSDQSTTVTITCAWIYLAARVIYVPAYVFGWVPWRSLFWLAGISATTIMLIATLV